jgi:hypothetical protein
VHPSRIACALPTVGANRSALPALEEGAGQLPSLLSSLNHPLHKVSLLQRARGNTMAYVRFVRGFLGDCQRTYRDTLRSCCAVSLKECILRATCCVRQYVGAWQSFTRVLSESSAGPTSRGPVGAPERPERTQLAYVRFFGGFLEDCCRSRLGGQRNVSWTKRVGRNFRGVEVRQL